MVGDERCLVLNLRPSTYRLLLMNISLKGGQQNTFNLSMMNFPNLFQRCTSSYQRRKHCETRNLSKNGFLRLRQQSGIHHKNSLNKISGKSTDAYEIQIMRQEIKYSRNIVDGITLKKTRTQNISTNLSVLSAHSIKIGNKLQYFLPQFGNREYKPHKTTRREFKHCIGLSLIFPFLSHPATYNSQLQ